MTPITVPNFLVAGGARCGTTGLVEGLRTHPGVFVTQPKEPHYFALHSRGAHFCGPGDDNTINRVAVTDREGYLALYPADTSPYVALGDGSVSTLYYHQDSLPEILAVNPLMRLVILLREPVDRAYSSHQYMRARGFEPHEDFLTAVADEPRRRQENWHHIWHYTHMSMYADAVCAVQSALPPEQIGIWFYEDFNRDAEGTVQEVLRFLELPPVEGEGVAIPRVNISGKPKFATVQQALWWATRNEWLRVAVKRSTSFRLRERVRRLMLERGGVPAEARAALQPLFAADVARLRTLLPGRVPEWLEAGAKEAS
jgi:Sulfotransferase domain